MIVVVLRNFQAKYHLLRVIFIDSIFINSIFINSIFIDSIFIDSIFIFYYYSNLIIYNIYN